MSGCSSQGLEDVILVRRKDASGFQKKKVSGRMFKEAMKTHEHPSGEWSEEEKEFLSVFMHCVGPSKLILDLAGGYGRVTPYLMNLDILPPLKRVGFHHHFGGFCFCF